MSDVAVVDWDLSDADFRALFEASPNLYLILDPQLTIVGVNNAYCTATMTDRDQILGRHLFNVFPDNPEEAGATGTSNLHASLNRVLATGRPDAMPPQKYDIQRPHSEGGGFEVRYWSPLNTPVLDKLGRVLWIIHRVEDITGAVRLQNETAALKRDVAARIAVLQDSTDFLNVVIENIPAMVVVKDATDLRFIFGNRAGDEMTGYPREATLGKTDFDLFPREQAEAFAALDREVLTSGQLRIIPEEPLLTAAGETRLLRTLKMPIFDTDGRPKYLLAMSEDITAQKRAEDALQHAETLSRGLLSASPDAVMALDGEGRIILVNERLRTMYGYEPAELIGRSATILTPADRLEDDSNRTRAAILASGTGATEIVSGLTGLRRDGTTFPTEATVMMHQTAKGPAVIISLRDVTERFEVESQLRQALKMEAVGNLTGGIAHDFNNLLSVIIGNLDLLRESLTRDAAADDLADQALSAALRGAELTRRLLAFARRQPLQPRQIDVNELVGSISSLLSRTLGDNIEIEQRLGDGVWPVTADPVQLEASIINIVTNARDAMPHGGQLLIATDNRHLDADYAELHRELSPGDYTLIEISDTGTGIPPDTLSHIFEPFFTTKEVGRGTGLGLSMVFGFMKQSKGHVNVYSEVGVGTTFRLYLPRSAESLAQQQAEPQLARTGGSETILAVEDNPNLRNLVVRQLRQLGYTVLEAPDGVSALKLLETAKIDLVFTDVSMPGGVSGYDLGRAVRQRWPNTSVLLTSGFPEEKLNGNAAPPWNMRLLSKPYRKDDLARTLREVLDE